MLRSVVIVFVSGLFVFQSGCVSLQSFIQADRPQLDTSYLKAAGYSIPPGGVPMYVEEESTSTEPQIVLEIRGGENERHIEKVPLPMERPVFVEDLVRQARLNDQLGKLNISIMRPTPEGPPIRLKVNTDSDGKAESIGSNYALQPGDHLVILEDNRSALERFMESQFKR